MSRILRVPASLDAFFRPLQGHFHWDHFTDVRLLVLTRAVLWGRRNVAHRYRYLEAPSHRTRCNNVFLVARWDPEAALRQTAQTRLRELHPQPAGTVYMVIEDGTQAKRGQWRAAVAKRKAPVTDTSLRGPQSVGAILVCRSHVIPWGIRL